MHPGAKGEFLDDDEIPPTLLPMIDLMVRDYMPEIKSMVAFIGQWAEENGPFASGDPVTGRRLISLGALDPIGYHEVPYRGTTLHLAIRRYMQWMFQRVQDVHSGLSDTGKGRAQAVLGGTGMIDCLNMDVPRRIDRVNNVEVFA